MSSGRRVVIGVGNRYRGDDSAGLEVAGLLLRHAPPDVEIMTLEGEPTWLLDVLSSSDLVILVDAIAGGARPGAIVRFDATEKPIPGTVFGASTHAFGLGETIELARMLGRVSGRVFVYGISGEDFSAGEELSASVASATATVADEILRALQEVTGEDPELEGVTHA
jgi:hydrogenase maturation protease